MIAILLLLATLQDPPKEEPKAPPVDPQVLKITEMVRARLADQVSKATGSKVKFEEALAKTAKLEETIVQESAEKLEISADDVREAWKKRERKPRKLSYGDGSWVVLGGQDGGLDSDVKGRPADTGELIPSGPSILTRRKPPPPSEPVPLGKALKTKDQWWTAASSAERAAFVEGEFARKSSMVEKKEDEKKCATCSGRGSVNANRGGIGLTVLCPRCHGTKEDVLVSYE